MFGEQIDALLRPPHHDHALRIRVDRQLGSREALCRIPAHFSRSAIQDGSTNWFEGMGLILVYVVRSPLVVLKVMLSSMAADHRLDLLLLQAGLRLGYNYDRPASSTHEQTQQGHKGISGLRRDFIFL
jgi:hypothetical protein